MTNQAIVIISHVNTNYIYYHLQVAVKFIHRAKYVQTVINMENSSNINDILRIYHRNRTCQMAMIYLFVYHRKKYHCTMQLVPQIRKFLNIILNRKQNQMRLNYFLKALDTRMRMPSFLIIIFKTMITKSNERKTTSIL